jgi:hypothetical protein
MIKTIKILAIDPIVNWYLSCEIPAQIGVVLLGLILFFVLVIDR